MGGITIWGIIFFQRSPYQLSYSQKTAKNSPFLAVFLQTSLTNQCCPFVTPVLPSSTPMLINHFQAPSSLRNALLEFEIIVFVVLGFDGF